MVLGSLWGFYMILNDRVLSGNSGPAHAVFCLDMCYFYSFIYWFLLRVQLSNRKYVVKGLLGIRHPFHMWPLGKTLTCTKVWGCWDHFHSFNPKPVLTVYLCFKCRAELNIYFFFFFKRRRPFSWTVNSSHFNLHKGSLFSELLLRPVFFCCCFCV